jgi:hypothetical protein
MRLGLGGLVRRLRDTRGGQRVPPEDTGQTAGARQTRLTGQGPSAAERGNSRQTRGPVQTQPRSPVQPRGPAQPETPVRPAGTPQAGRERELLAGSRRSGRPGSPALPRRWGIARLATRAAPAARAAAGQRREATQVQSGRVARSAAEPKPPWYEIAQHNRTAPGRRHCGRLEELIHREWAEGAVPPPELVHAIDRLAELPQLVKSKLATGLDAIHVGVGGVPDLDGMASLSGVRLPGGRGTWNDCAGAYGDRKIIVGSRPSPTPDVTCHEVGHALDDLDGLAQQWQSDSTEFRSLYSQCVPHMVSAFHRQPGHLGRREFFADAFAAIASRQRPALVEMLGGDTRTALNVMLYFNVRYGI